MPFKERERGQTYSEATMATDKQIEAAARAAHQSWLKDEGYEYGGLTWEELGEEIQGAMKRRMTAALTAAEQVRASEGREALTFAIALANLTDAFLLWHGCFPSDQTNIKEKTMNAAMHDAYELIGQPGTDERKTKLNELRA